MEVPGYKHYLAAIVTKGDHSWRLQRNFDGHSVLFSVDGLAHSRFDSHPPVDLPATAVVDDGKWHHVAAVYDGATETIYIDGAPDVFAPCSGFPAVENAPVFLGENSGDVKRALNGELCDVRLYDRALSPAEVGLLATRHR